MQHRVVSRSIFVRHRRLPTTKKSRVVDRTQYVLHIKKIQSHQQRPNRQLIENNTVKKPGQKKNSKHKSRRRRRRSTGANGRVGDDRSSGRRADLRHLVRIHIRRTSLWSCFCRRFDDQIVAMICRPNDMITSAS